jgi:hypothetical protein
MATRLGKDRSASARGTLRTPSGDRGAGARAVRGTAPSADQQLLSFAVVSPSPSHCFRSPQTDSASEMHMFVLPLMTH